MKKANLTSFFQGDRVPVGAGPGTLLLHPDAEPPVITITRYGPEKVDTQYVATADEIKRLCGEGYPVTWINIDGLADLDLITAIGDMFDFRQIGRAHV